MVTNVYTVPGMACRHAVAALTRQISMLRGVMGVGVDHLGADRAEFRVVSRGPGYAADVRSAVREAGYEIAEAGEL
ncbi:heavy-metal-associated domain-containing protein, partial [Georgenia sp. 10Sc9-8]|nr:heavy-metal-associated domain-containing protein [Georgenia halotolerans]